MADAVRVVPTQSVAFPAPAIAALIWMKMGELAMVNGMAIIRSYLRANLLDINECQTAMALCPMTFVCNNLIGGFECVCPLGTTRSSETSDESMCGKRQLQ